MPINRSTLCLSSDLIRSQLSCSDPRGDILFIINAIEDVIVASCRRYVEIEGQYTCDSRNSRAVRLRIGFNNDIGRNCVRHVHDETQKW